MNRLALLAAGAAASLLPGFAMGAVPASCPAKPGYVLRSTQFFYQYLGSEPGQPDVCRIIHDGQTVTLYYYGIWDKAWPGAEAARRALQTVINGPPGTVAAFDTVAVPGLQWHETIRNGGVEDLNLLGRTFHTLKLVHERTGFGGNSYHSIVTLWKDFQTGMIVYGNYQHISGTPSQFAGWDPVAISQ
jgi:hypothetical protein